LTQTEPVSDGIAMLACTFSMTISPEPDSAGSLLVQAAKLTINKTKTIKIKRFMSLLHIN
jgi:hypothetical protein